MNYDNYNKFNKTENISLLVGWKAIVLLLDSMDMDEVMDPETLVIKHYPTCGCMETL